MLKINQIKLPLTADEHDLRRAAGKALRLDENRIRTLRVTKKAVDSRKKDNIFFVYNVEVDVDGEERNTAVELNTELEDSSAEQSGS